MSKQNKILIKGKVIEVCTNSTYKVLLENNVKINANICGKMRLCNIRILPGDIVQVELSPYDLSWGRIVSRLS